MRRSACLIVAALGLLPAFALAATSAIPLPAVMAITLQRHDAGTFYVKGAIEGYGELDLLVDTGASYLVINQAILDDLRASGDAEYSRELHGVMADGSGKVIPIYRLTGLRLGDNCWIRDVEAAVFPGRSRAILGMNVLAQLAPFTFTAEPPQLSLNQCRTLLVPADTAAADVVAPGPTAGK